jgi:serine/threonine-protein kinase
MTTQVQVVDTSKPTTVYSRLSHPHTKALWRAGWLLVAALTIAIYLATIPDSYNRYLRDADRLFADALPRLGLTPQFYAVFFLILVNGVGLVCIVTAGVIFWRRSDDKVALLMSAALMTFVPILGGPASRLPFDQPLWLWPVIVGQVISSTCILVTFYLVPDGRFVPSWTRWLVIPFLLWEIPRVIDNQGIGSLFPRLPIPTIFLTVVLWFGTDVYAQIYRYRRSTPAQQHQTRWVVFGFATAIFGLMLFLLSELFIFPLVREDSLARLLYRMFVNLFFIYGPAAVVPISLAIAVLRYRLYDIDLIINRGLVYGTLTLLLALVYFVVVTLVQAITNQSDLALAASSLLISFLFLPTRRRLQNVIDHRFYGLRLNLNQLAALQKPKAIANPGALTGRRLGAYQVEGVLGRGGMGEVYKGYQMGLNRPVAIKVMPPELAANPEYRARFEREAQTVASLRHPNIVQVFDFGSHDDLHYMVMEYLEGKELNDYLYEQSKLTLPETRSILRDVAAALDYAHSMGLVHRDVKPSNVMLQNLTSARLEIEETVRAVLMDFGITKWVTAGAGMTHTGILGTLDYMAPEQIISARQVDQRADIYALGVMAYHMLTGKKPFVSENAGQLLFAHLQQPPPDPRHLDENIPSPVAKAILKAMSKQPEDRFQSAGEFAAALD